MTGLVEWVSIEGKRLAATNGGAVPERLARTADGSLAPSALLILDAASLVLTLIVERISVWASRILSWNTWNVRTINASVLPILGPTCGGPQGGPQAP